MDYGPMRANVLLVDDDVELLELLADYLTRDGFSVTCAAGGSAVVAEAQTGRHDIVILDVMMPGSNGLSLLARIRAESAVPVVMLTARGDDADRIAGLELGADDYVPKPCTPRELAARLRAILKRAGGAVDNGGPAASRPIVVGRLTLWPGRRRAEYGGRALDLTSTEFNLLEMLARRAGLAVAKAELSEQALGRPFNRFDRSIDVHISSIRHKLGPAAMLADGSPLIETVIRKGYQLRLG